MRCFLAPAVLVSKDASYSSGLKLASTAAAAGELVADKTPYIGSRLDAGPLAGRIVSGALCGARVAAGKEGNPVTGAAAGALAAYLSAHVFYHLRRTSTSAGIPDLAFALAEDAAAFAIGSKGCSNT
jgi:uncharacterized membrane protein